MFWLFVQDINKDWGCFLCLLLSPISYVFRCSADLFIQRASGFRWRLWLGLFTGGFAFQKSHSMHIWFYGSSSLITMPLAADMTNRKPDLWVQRQKIAEGWQRSICLSTVFRVPGCSNPRAYPRMHMGSFIRANQTTCMSLDYSRNLEFMGTCNLHIQSRSRIQTPSPGGTWPDWISMPHRIHDTEPGTYCLLAVNMPKLVFSFVWFLQIISDYFIWTHVKKGSSETSSWKPPASRPPWWHVDSHMSVGREGPSSMDVVCLNGDVSQY